MTNKLDAGAAAQDSSTGTSEKPKKEVRVVTSSKTLDFPSLDWAIRAGETRELPIDEQAAREILSNHFIAEVK